MDATSIERMVKIAVEEYFCTNGYARPYINENDNYKIMNIKHFFEIYPPKRMWRKLWIGIATLPMMPQHRAKCLKIGG